VAPAQFAEGSAPVVTGHVERSEASDDQVALGGVQEETEKEVAQTLQDMSQMQELLKDFSVFEALYQAQQELAAQAQAYNRAGELSREDQLALKELAATETWVTLSARGKLRRMPKLQNFLKAQSGRDLATRSATRLQPLARHHRTNARGQRRSFNSRTGCAARWRNCSAVSGRQPPVRQ
jgi:TolA-binding protein